MSLIDTSYFVGPLTVAQLGQTSVENALQLCIDQNEPEFLQAVLGYELYDAFSAGVTASDPNYLNIKNGLGFVSTTNFPGYLPMWVYRNWYMNSKRKVQWVGFTPSTTPYQSPIAAYVYFKYMRDLISQSTGVGIVQAQPENATAGVGQRKMVDAWNRMASDIAGLWLYMSALGTDVFPAYDITKIDFFRFTPINMFNI